MIQAARTPMSRLAAILAAGLLFVTLTIGIATLARQAVVQIISLNTASSDNLQWTLAQTEVEFLTFYNVLLKVDAGQTVELPALRRWFDIFYSRMGTVSNGQIYAQLTGREKLQKCFDIVRQFLDRTAILMDGPDAQLLSAAPQIAVEATAIRGKVRDISLEGIRVFSALSDVRRKSASETLSRVAGLTATLVLLLMFGMFWLARLYRFGRAQTLEIQGTRDRLQAMLNTSLDAVLVVDRAGRFVEFNGAASDIFGYSQAEALGAEMTQLIFPPHLIAGHVAGMRRHAETGAERMIGAGRVQAHAKRKSGQVFPVELSIAKTKSPNGEIFVSYMRDISDRRDAEEKLTQARDEALAGERAKARFIAVMSHEMRTPLNGLLGSLDLLNATPLTLKQTQFTQMMQVSGQMLLNHVNDVLDIARLEGGPAGISAAPFDIEALIDDVLVSQSALARAKNLDIRQISATPRIGFIDASASGLRQVVLNLVSNAIKFTERGSVTVQLERRPDRMLRLWVRDTGAGIAVADQVRIFDDFVTLDSSFGRKADGTGLGLGIARRVVQAMGGAIGVDSRPQNGSDFWIDLPFVPALSPKTAAITPPNTRRKPSLPMDILVVEDNQINRTILREMLHAAGHRVTEAQDGLAGLHRALTQHFDAIFMDISMPQLDGIAATVQLRAGQGRSSSAPIIALTAHAMPEDRALFLAAGMNAVLTKPIERAMLTQVLAEVAGQSPHAKTPQDIHDMASPESGPESDPESGLLNGAMAELEAALGKEKLQTLTARYLAEGDAALTDITARLDAGECAAAQASAHHFSGSSATFGAAAMQQVLAGIEADLKQGRTASARAALPRLNLIWPATKAALQRR